MRHLHSRKILQLVVKRYLKRKGGIYVGNEVACVVGPSIHGKEKAVVILRKHTLVVG